MLHFMVTTFKILFVRLVLPMTSEPIRTTQQKNDGAYSLLPTAKVNTRNALPICQDKFGYVV